MKLNKCLACGRHVMTMELRITVLFNAVFLHQQLGENFMERKVLDEKNREFERYIIYDENPTANIAETILRGKMGTVLLDVLKRILFGTENNIVNFNEGQV